MCGGTAQRGQKWGLVWRWVAWPLRLKEWKGNMFMWFMFTPRMFVSSLARSCLVTCRVGKCHCSRLSDRPTVIAEDLGLHSTMWLYHIVSYSPRVSMRNTAVAHVVVSPWMGFPMDSLQLIQGTYKASKPLWSLDGHPPLWASSGSGSSFDAQAYETWDELGSDKTTVDMYPLVI